MFEQWKKDNRRILERFVGKKVILLFSGGKDSSLALYFLKRAMPEFEYTIEPHAGVFPSHRYSRQDVDNLELYWRNFGISINWHYFEQNDEVLEHVGNPCLLCQKIRKRRLGSLFQNLDMPLPKIVVATSYTLTDLASYGLEHIMGHVFNGQTGPQDKTAPRSLETAQRFYPLLEMKEGYLVYRPLIKINEAEVEEQIKAYSIPVLTTACKYRNFRPKRVLEDYFKKMGLSFNYDSVFNFMKKVPKFPLNHPYSTLDKEQYLNEIF